MFLKCYVFCKLDVNLWLEVRSVDIQVKTHYYGGGQPTGINLKFNFLVSNFAQRSYWTLGSYKGEVLMPRKWS